MKDPKQIVTPHAFEVHPDLLGLPLATPKRRMAALLIDLLIASILSALGSFVLACSVTILFFWLAIKSKGEIWWKNVIRYSAASVAAIFVFSFTYYFTQPGNSDSETKVRVNNEEVATGQDVDWGEFTNTLMTTDFTDEKSVEEFERKIEESVGVSSLESSEEELSFLFDKQFLTDLQSFQAALISNDTSAVDTLRPMIASIVATSELNIERNKNRELRESLSEATDENTELKEQVENPSFLRSVKATIEDLGLRIGWFGIYFIICLPLFSGRTLGKRLLSLRVARLNNKPIGIWYSFERFGGYAAGIATGLLGFFQIYWDANRQGIHDKIASTVVLDERKKRMEKYADLRREIISEENLLD